MNYIIHKVKKPFMSRLGQFAENERTLVIGIDLQTVNRTDGFIITLGNTKTKYRIASEEVLEAAHKHQSFWTNKDGKVVVILPLSYCEKLEEGGVVQHG